MDYFEDILVIPSKDGSKRKLVRALDVKIGNLNIHIPEGFETDYASIPRGFWGLLPPFGKYLRAAIVHDFLYSIHNTYGINKTIADKIFYNLMITDNTNKIKAWLMYKAVQGFGKPSFKTPKVDGSVPYEDQAVWDRTDEAKEYYSKMAELLGEEYNI